MAPFSQSPSWRLSARSTRRTWRLPLGSSHCAFESFGSADHDLRSVSYLFRATGSVLGISITTATLQNSLKKELPKYITGPDADEIISHIRSDVAYIRTLKGQVREGAISAYQDSMRLTFVLIAVLCVSRTVFAHGSAADHPLAAASWHSCRSSSSSSITCRVRWTGRSERGGRECGVDGPCASHPSARFVSVRAEHRRPDFCNESRRTLALPEPFTISRETLEGGNREARDRYEPDAALLHVIATFTRITVHEKTPGLRF